MAGTAFLPWEQWIARLLHPLYVAARRWLYAKRRQRSLAESKGWPEAEATIFAIGWDSSLPREEVSYSYCAKQEYYSGSHWHWFDKSDAREVRAGDRVAVRYNIKHPEESVFLRFL